MLIAGETAGKALYISFTADGEKIAEWCGRNRTLQAFVFLSAKWLVVFEGSGEMTKERIGEIAKTGISHHIPKCVTLVTEARNHRSRLHEISAD